MLDLLSGAVSSAIHNSPTVNPSKKFKFSCKKCDFYTNKSFNYFQHIKTMKHKITNSSRISMGGILCPILDTSSNTSFDDTSLPNPDTISFVPNTVDMTYVNNVNDNDNQQSESRKTYHCKKCNKPYFSKKGVWQHTKKCNYTTIAQPVNVSASSPKENISPEVMTAFMIEVMKANHTHMLEVMNVVLTSLKSNPNLSAPPSLPAPSSAPDYGNRGNQPQQQQQMIPTAASTSTDINGGSVSIHGNQNNVNAPTTKNSNNKTYNMNMFLNEKCKDAMNITEFANGIELNNEDMEDVGTHGFVKGISKILMDNLEKTDITMRPIHCTDHKREVMAVKEENKWERTSLDCKKLIDVVRVIEKKNLLLINQWAEEHPECSNSDTSANRMYMKLHKNADGDDASISKVLKNVAKKVYIDKDELAELCE